MFLKFVYSFAIGIALAIFVGYTVSAINPGVSWREQDKCYERSDLNPESAGDEFESKQDEADKCYEEFEAKRADNNEQRTYWLLGGIAILGASYLFATKKTKIDSTLIDGIGFGLVFTSFYALTLSNLSYSDGSNRLLNVGVAALLLVSTIIVTYYSFILANKQSADKQPVTKKTNSN